MKNVGRAAFMAVWALTAASLSAAAKEEKWESRSITDKPGATPVKDVKDLVRRAITNQVARAERNLLVEKNPDSPNRKSSYRLTDRGNLQIQAGLQMRAA